jgi:hypothetical protein
VADLLYNHANGIAPHGKEKEILDSNSILDLEAVKLPSIPIYTLRLDI